MKTSWEIFNPTATFLGNRRGWPTYVLPNGVYVIVTKVERNIVGLDNFEAAVAATPCRVIRLTMHEDPWCASGGHELRPIPVPMIAPLTPLPGASQFMPTPLYLGWDFIGCWYCGNNFVLRGPEVWFRAAWTYCPCCGDAWYAPIQVTRD